MNDLVDIIVGRLTPAARIWLALAPGLAILAYMLGGAFAFWLHHRRRPGDRDEEMVRRGATVILPQAVRQYFSFVMRPVWRLILAVGLPANVLTTLAVLLVAGAAVAGAAGRFALAGWLYLAGGLCDFFDGRLARHHGTASPAGAALDSVLDRLSDGMILIGLSWYYRDTWILPILGLLLVSTFLVSYARAKAEALGITGLDQVGIMRRPERVVFLGLALALSPVLAAIHSPGDPHPLHRLTAFAVILIAICTATTAARRILFLLRALDPQTTAPPWTSLDRGGLLRFTISSAIATALDFVALLAMVELLGMPPWLAALGGAVLGGVVNFTINRVWAFGVEGPPVGQAGRYAVTSGTSALLYAGGVAVITSLPGVDYRIAWAITAGCVFLFWNYPMNRDYVFREPAPPHGGTAERPARHRDPAGPALPTKGDAT